VTAETVAAAIIAGGRARRFGGRDKSRLVVRGRPIIVRQMEAPQRVANDIGRLTSCSRTSTRQTSTPG
jgi:GTP:adenosylcobinamide-phosphate guanylyltransferase